MLSEVHHHSYRHLPDDSMLFAPADISTLAHSAGSLDSHLLSKKIFTNSIVETKKYVESYGVSLLLRVHEHTDYCTGLDYKNGNTVRNYPAEFFNLVSVPTIRNPIATYLSLHINWWFHFSPPTFEEYCKRYIQFLHGVKEAKVLKYEDFVNDPEAVISEFCSVLELDFSINFMSYFDTIRVTGDSWRKSLKIENRESRSLPEGLTTEIENSDSFKTISERFGYAL